jgi:hypothetical protein
MMGEEIGQKFTPNNLQLENQAKLTLEETNEWSHLNLDDATFTLLIAISPHIVAMLNELDNLLVLDTILNGKPIGLRNSAN